MNYHFYRKLPKLVFPIVVAAILLVNFLPISGVAAQTNAQLVKKLEIVLVIDNSRSMLASDPQNERIVAARFLVGYLQAISQVLDEDLQIKISVVTFGQVNQTELPLTPIEDEAVFAAIAAGIINGTDFIPPFQFAVEQLQAGDPEAQKAIIVFTDGEPLGVDGSRVNLPEYFAQLREVADQLPDNTRALVVSIGDPPQSENGQQWRALLLSNQLGQYRPLEQIDSLADEYYQFIATLLGFTISPPITLLDGQSATIPLSPYLERIIFSTVKDSPDVRITTRDNLGEVVTGEVAGGGEELYEIHFFNLPDYGGWTIQADGGNAQLWVDRSLPMLRLTTPVEQPHPVNVPLTLEGRLLRQGMPVIDPDLRLNATIRTAAQTFTQTLASSAEGVYQLNLSADDLSAIGEDTYTIALNASVNGVPVQARPADISFVVGAATIVEATPTASTPIALTPDGTLLPDTPTATIAPIVIDGQDNVANPVFAITVALLLVSIAVAFLYGRYTVKQELQTYGLKAKIEFQIQQATQLKKDLEQSQDEKKQREEYIHQLEQKIESLESLDLNVRDPQTEELQRIIDNLKAEKKQNQKEISSLNAKINRLEINLSKQISDLADAPRRLFNEAQSTKDPQEREQKLQGALQLAGRAIKLIQAEATILSHLFTDIFSAILDAYNATPYDDPPSLHEFLTEYGDDPNSQKAMARAFIKHWVRKTENGNSIGRIDHEMHFVFSHQKGKRIIQFIADENLEFLEELYEKWNDDERRIYHHLFKKAGLLYRLHRIANVTEHYTDFGD